MFAYRIAKQAIPAVGYHFMAVHYGLAQGIQPARIFVDFVLKAPVIDDHFVSAWFG